MREGVWKPLPPWTVGRTSALAREVMRVDRVLTKSLPAGLAPFLEYDGAGHRLRARYVAGWLRVGELDLVVIPACVSDGPSWLETFSSWFLLAAEQAPQSVAYLSGRLALDRRDDTLLDLLALRYLRSLSRAVEEQPLVAYDRVVMRTPESRGRLLVERNSRLLPHQLLALWHERSVLGLPSSAFQLLGWATSWLAQRARLAPVRQGLQALGLDLPESEEPPAVGGAWRLTAGAAAYEEPLAIARDLARRVRNGTRESKRDDEHPAFASLLMKTYEAYEALISAGWAEVAASKGWTHRAQQKRTLATVASGTGDAERETRTDDALSTRRGRTILVSDSKYKLDPDRGVSREDLYQSISTCVSHEVEHGLLVLPHGPDQPVALQVESSLLSRQLKIVVVRTPIAGRSPHELLVNVSSAVEQAVDLLLHAQVSPA